MPWYQGLQPGIKAASERNLAHYTEEDRHIVDRQFEKPQVFWRTAISIVGSMKNLNRALRQTVILAFPSIRCIRRFHKASYSLADCLRRRHCSRRPSS